MMPVVACRICGSERGWVEMPEPVALECVHCHAPYAASCGPFGVRADSVAQHNARLTYAREWLVKAIDRAKEAVDKTTGDLRIWERGFADRIVPTKAPELPKTGTFKPSEGQS